MTNLRNDTQGGFPGQPYCVLYAVYVHAIKEDAVLSILGEAGSCSGIF